MAGYIDHINFGFGLEIKSELMKEKKI